MHRVDSLICTPKKWQSSLALNLDHSRLGLENKSGRIFCVRQVYFTKSCQQIWVRVNHILYFLYITFKVKEYYEALFLSYRPQTKLRICSCLACVYQVIDARGKFGGEHERCVRVARGAAESNSSLLIALQTFFAKCIRNSIYAQLKA